MSVARSPIAFLIVTALTLEVSLVRATPPENVRFQLDPLLLVSLQQCRIITKALGDQLYPG
jgi:hypothetical protein